MTYQINKDIESFYQKFWVDEALKKEQASPGEGNHTLSKEILSSLKELISADGFKALNQSDNKRLTELARQTSIDQPKYTEIGEIVKKVLSPSQKELTGTLLATSSEVTGRALTVKEGGIAGQTTNPVLFLAKTMELSKQVPSNLAAVFKSRFSTGISSPQIAKKIYSRLMEIGFNSKNPPKGEYIREVTKNELKELYTGYIADEAETFYTAVINAFCNDYGDSQKVYANKEIIKFTEPLKQTCETLNKLFLSTVKIAGIVNELTQIRERFINTALFANEYDAICETDLSPETTEQQLTLLTETVGSVETLQGILQEKMVYVPLFPIDLNLSLEGEDYKACRERSVIAFDRRVSLDEYQQAVLRATELGDADLHNENVALVPMRDEEVFAPFTKLNPLQRVNLLEDLEGKIDLTNIRDRLLLGARAKKGATDEEAKVQVETFFKGLCGLDDKDASPTDQLITEKLSNLQKSLTFSIKHFDVDLTMPETNERGVTGGISFLRNSLLAFPKADQPLTEATIDALKLRKEKGEELTTIANTRFGKKTAKALGERIDRLVKASDETGMTAKGLVWRACPNFKLLDCSYDRVNEEEEVGKAEKYFDIGFSSNYDEYPTYAELTIQKIESEEVYPIPQAKTTD